VGCNDIARQDEYRTTRTHAKKPHNDIAATHCVLAFARNRARATAGDWSHSTRERWDTADHREQSNAERHSPPAADDRRYPS
jgi:hypothetical protein